MMSNFPIHSREASAQVSTIKNNGATQVSTINSTATSQISSINSSGSTQVNNVKSEGTKQIALATEQANLSKYYAESCAPAPLGSKLSVPANKKVPDGYEPVWYKNTITRARYPDFFEQLVDTNSLVLVTEDTYDSQVSTYGMCASYVKVDANTLILPLLVNFGRGGNLDQLGGVQNDQFQGHYHIAQIRQDVYGSGDGAAIGTTNGTDEGLRQDGPDLFILNPKTGAHGTARFGTETRPKAYYELTYIKCADISRPLTSEETSEIRANFGNKLNNDFSNFSKITSAFRDVVVSNCMPNYAGAKTVSLPYTATQNGVFFYRGANASNAVVKFSIDGFECWFNGYGTSNGGSFPVPKNSVVKIVANPLSNAVFSFIPYKEV